MYMALPNQMTAIEIVGGAGGADALRAAQTPLPVVKTGEILIRVHAAGVNRPDIVQRQGGYPPPPGAPATLGLEVAGEVVIGAGRWREGDRVCALLGGGGYAQYAAVDARHALPVPAGLDMIQAASLPETVFTAFVNLFEHGALKRGETLLIHAGTSGIGVTAIQMGKAAGARVIATVRGADKAAAVQALGADLVLDATAQDFGAAVKAAGGADVILDMVGGPYLAGNLDALNMRGRIVYIASLGGAELSVPVFALMRKQAVLTGSTLRPRSADEKARLAAAVEATVWPWIEHGKIKTVIDRAYRLEEAAQAHAFMDERHLGKVVLTAI
jgi:putative PIG3 family NAD(P)H quinone oxidoreductase